MWRDRVWLPLAMVSALLLTGCASRSRTAARAGVPIDARPTPSPPPPETGSAAGPEPQPSPEVSPQVSAADRKETLARILADTTAASAAVRRCANRQLLPDDESALESTRGYLIQARAALTRDELWRAESLARRARQLSRSLDCR